MIVKPPLYIPLKRAAEYAGVSRYTILNAIATGKVKAIHHDDKKRWDVDINSVNAWLEKREK